MAIRQWLATVLALTLLLGPSAPLVIAQYAEGLPAGVVAAAVDGQPIDAENVPRTNEAAPQISGRINNGLPSVDVAIADGEVVRFVLEVDARGRFRGSSPSPLAPGEYSLYFFDNLIGTFVVEESAGAAQRDRGQGANRFGIPDLDIARVVPFPFDFGETIPGLGLLDGRFFTLEDEARRIATTEGEASPEALEGVRNDLRDSGWLSRYESRLAVPLPDDPTRFSDQVSSFVILYDDAESAQEAFAALTGAEPTIPGETIGDESEVVALSGTTPDTGVEYQALRIIYRLDRLLGMIILADLTGADIDQALLESAAQAVVERGAEVLAAETPGLSPRALRLDLSEADAVVLDEAYEVVDGVLVALYDEDDPLQAARVATYSGSFDGYAGSATALVPGDGGAAGAATTRPIAFGTTLLSFPSTEDADAWLAGLPDRLREDPLRGYLSFAPVEDAPVSGEASATYALQRQIGDEVAAGFRVYTRVGSEIAAIEYAAVPEATLADIEALVAAQIACLEASACPSAAPIPGLQSTSSTPVAGEEDEDGAVRREDRDNRNREGAEDGAGGEADIGADADETPPAAEAPTGGVVDIVPTEEPAEDGEGGVRDVGA